MGEKLKRKIDQTVDVALEVDLKFSYCSIATFVRGQSRSSHSALYDAADRVDEAGLSSSVRSIQKDSDMFDVLVSRLILLHILEISRIVSVKTGLHLLLDFNELPKFLLLDKSLDSFHKV